MAPVGLGLTGCFGNVKRRMTVPVCSAGSRDDRNSQSRPRKLGYRRKRDTDCNALLNHAREKQFAGELRTLGFLLGPTVNSHVIFRNLFPPQASDFSPTKREAALGSGSHQDRDLWLMTWVQPQGHRPLAEQHRASGVRWIHATLDP